MRVSVEEKCGIVNVYCLASRRMWMWNGLVAFGVRNDIGWYIKSASGESVMLVFLYMNPKP